jgi:DNA-binding transcriptional MocR family regulator
MLQFSLDATAPIPLVDQLVAAVRRQVDDRILRPGMRLPPIRGLAERQGVSRFTVVEAYDRLVALGYLQSRRGSGFYVAPRPLPAGPAPAPERDRAVDVAWMLRQAFAPDDGRLKVGRGWLPAEWLDEEGLRRHLRTLSRRPDAHLAEYGTPLGYLPLRQQLQLRLAQLGIGARPEQILLTQGASQALDLAARLLVKPGDCVFVDDPGYFSLFGNLRLHGAKLVGVPRSGQGPDPAALETLLESHRPRVFFTQSVLHNPTADSLSAANAFRILQLAERHDFIVVEDDIYGDFQPGSATRLTELDQLDRVLYVSSFSKTLSGSLRVGFVAGRPDLIAELTDIKLLSALPGSELPERIVYLMLTEGHYRKYLDRLHGRLAGCQEQAQRLLERHGLAIHGEPKHGMFVWARLPGVEDTAGIAAEAAHQGIMLAPGKVFRPQMQASPCLRFNVTATADPRFGRFLGEALAAPGRTHPQHAKALIS